MPNWSTQLFAEYVLSTEDAILSGTESFTVTASGGQMITPQSGILGFTVTMINLKWNDSGTGSFTIFPQSRTGAQVTDLTITKDRLKNLTIK